MRSGQTADRDTIKKKNINSILFYLSQRLSTQQRWNVLDSGSISPYTKIITSSNKKIEIKIFHVMSEHFSNISFF